MLVGVGVTAGAEPPGREAGTTGRGWDQNSRSSHVIVVITGSFPLQAVRYSRVARQSAQLCCGAVNFVGRPSHDWSVARIPFVDPVMDIQRSGERIAEVGGLSLCYETFGNPTDETVLLVMGLGLSMLYWREEFCADLARRGFHVVRFDNRDVGRSSTCPGPGISGWQFLRRRARPVYTIGDMADDAAGLLDAIAVGSAHVVGRLAGVVHRPGGRDPAPGRTRSLISIMGRPGDGRTGRLARRMLPAVPASCAPQRRGRRRRTWSARSAGSAPTDEPRPTTPTCAS